MLLLTLTHLSTFALALPYISFALEPTVIRLIPSHAIDLLLSLLPVLPIPMCIGVWPSLHTQAAFITIEYFLLFETLSALGFWGTTQAPSFPYVLPAIYQLVF